MSDQKWKWQLEYIRGDDQRYLDAGPGMTFPQIARALRVQPSTVEQWAYGYRKPRAMAQAAIAALYRREVKRREGRK